MSYSSDSERGSRFLAALHGGDSRTAEEILGTEPELAKALEPFVRCALGAAGLLDRIVSADPSVLDARIEHARFPGTRTALDHACAHALGGNATLLHVAARFDRVECARVLLDRGMPVDVLGDYDDCAPLHVAAWNGHTRVAGLLLDHGADIERESGAIHGTSVVCWAIVAGRPDMVRFLFERGARYRPYYLREAQTGLEKGARFTDATKDDMSAIVELVEAAAGTG